MKRPEILASWDEVQHDPLTIPPDNFTDLAHDEAVELIEEWFFENFEDPANSTPHESAEGGYQYIWGGPYYTRDIIENVFADTATDELITAAVKWLERKSSLWVPSIRRRKSPEDDGEMVVEWLDPAAAHAELQQQLLSLGEALAALPASPPGLGHNNPPETIEAVPYTPEDRAEIVSAVAALQAQPVTPVDDGKAATEAATVLEKKAGKFREWLVRQGDNFVTEFVKESGKKLAQLGWPALFVWIVEQMFSVSGLVTKWLTALGIGLPF